MLQPVDWSRPPESLEREIAPDRLGVYRIVWNSTIACTLRGPYLNYERTLFDVGGVSLSAMAVDASPSKRGYWPFRQDFPPSPWPLAPTPPLKGPFNVVEARAVRAGGISLGELILEMESRSIGTPATTASLLETAIDGTERRLGPILQLEWRNSIASYDNRWLVRLSSKGKSALEGWKRADLLSDSNERQKNIERVADGEMTPEEVLKRRFDIAGERLERIQQSIAERCDRWRGLSQEDGLRAMTREQAKPPKLSGLPRWLDPEVLLPKEHPLRKIRVEMEGELAVRHPTWTGMPNEDKVALRRAWLNEKRLIEPSIPDLDDGNAQFSALTHWLSGQTSIPTMENQDSP